MRGKDVTPPPRLTFDWSDKDCHVCSRPLRLKVTKKRKVLSTTYGQFRAVERQGHCPEHPALPLVRSRELARIVAPGANVGYDVLVRVGLWRFLECRQCEEITYELSRQHGIEVPARTVSHLAQKFVAYFVATHEASTTLLRRSMRDRGGYILHIDGTCEGGSRVLLVCMDSLSGQVLASRKIGSENEEEVKGVLEDVRRDWGVPLAVVHDLCRAFIIAAGKVFKSAPQFVCHYHLAADVGKDILLPHVDRLRGLLRRTRVRPKLRALVRSLNEFAVSKENAEPMVDAVVGLRSMTRLQQNSTPEMTKSVVHALSSWILAFSSNGEGYGFPFDMPYLTFYKRIVEVHCVLSEATDIWPKEKRGPLAPLKRLKHILDTVVASDNTPEIRKIVAETKRDRKVFERFRTALRICPKGGKKRRNDEGAPNLSPRRHEAVLRKLRTSLKRRARSHEPEQRASKIIVDHLDKYWTMLFGHVLTKRSTKIVVPRTNNVEERLFRTVKRQCRRLHGRGHLSRDIETILPATPLILNLKNHGYCETVYGGQEPERIAERFSAIDPTVPVQIMKTWRVEKLLTRIPRKLEKKANLPQELARFITVAIRELREDRS